MPEGSFEPTVMFFGLTNLPAMFQTIMNNLLRDLVVEEKIVVFINNMMIVMEINVMGRLDLNNFYFLFFHLSGCIIIFF